MKQWNKTSKGKVKKTETFLNPKGKIHIFSFMLRLNYMTFSYCVLSFSPNSHIKYFRMTNYSSEEHYKQVCDFQIIGKVDFKKYCNIREMCETDSCLSFLSSSPCIPVRFHFLLIYILHSHLPASISIHKSLNTLKLGHMGSPWN